MKIGKTIKDYVTVEARRNASTGTVQAVDFDRVKVTPNGTSKSISARVIGSADKIKPGDTVDILFTENGAVAYIPADPSTYSYELEDHGVNHSENSKDWIKPISIGAANKMHTHNADDISTLGLDADLLDGKHASAFALVDHEHVSLVLTAHTHNPLDNTDGGPIGFHGCKLEGDSVSITSGSNNNFPYLYELYDTDEFHDVYANTDRVVIPTGFAGYYNITVLSEFDGTTTGEFRVGIWVNGLTMIGKSHGKLFLASELDEAGPKVTTSIDHYLEEDDYITVTHRQNSGSSLGVISTLCFKYLGA